MFHRCVLPHAVDIAHGKIWPVTGLRQNTQSCVHSWARDMLTPGPRRKFTPRARASSPSPTPTFSASDLIRRQTDSGWIRRRCALPSDRQSQPRQSDAWLAVGKHAILAAEQRNLRRASASAPSHPPSAPLQATVADRDSPQMGRGSWGSRKKRSRKQQERTGRKTSSHFYRWGGFDRPPMSRKLAVATVLSKRRILCRVGRESAEWPAPKTEKC